jgi:hypothetical protein
VQQVGQEEGKSGLMNSGLSDGRSSSDLSGGLGSSGLGVRRFSACSHARLL